jgi:hypothetical protein
MKQILQTARVLAASLVVSASLSAQQRPAATDTPALGSILERLGAAAEAQLHSLPNFTCDEAATSQLIQNHKIRTEVHVQGTVRVVRSADGSINETYTYKRPFHLLFIPTRIPFYVSGGFDSALSYFLPAAQPCYQFTLSSGRVNFATRSTAVPGHICKERGLTGYVLLNSAGDVTHIQRTLPENIAKPLKIASFAAIDLAPVELNGKAYLLSQHIIATQPLADGEGHFDATYSNCRLFTATVTIGPATEVSPQPPVPTH